LTQLIASFLAFCREQKRPKTTTISSTAVSAVGILNGEEEND
jgi:hypothetical protein